MLQVPHSLSSCCEGERLSLYLPFTNTLSLPLLPAALLDREYKDREYKDREYKDREHKYCLLLFVLPGLVDDSCGFA